MDWFEGMIIGALLLSGIFVGMNNFQNAVITNYSVSLSGIDPNQTALPDYTNDSQSLYTETNNLVNQSIGSSSNTAGLIFGVAAQFFIVLFALPGLILKMMTVFITTTISILGLPYWVTTMVMSILVIVLAFVLLRASGVLKGG